MTAEEHALLIGSAQMLASGGTGIPHDRFIVPFTSAGLRTDASTRVALPPLTTVYYAVRACYPVPAGCLDPVVSDGLAMDSVPPLARCVCVRVMGGGCAMSLLNVVGFVSGSKGLCRAWVSPMPCVLT